MSYAFSCQMCGQCCQGSGGIVLTDKDIRRLATGLEISPQALAQTYTVYECAKLVLTCNDDGTCIFFAPGRGCTVHRHKPDVCRAWPFFRGNLEDEASWRMAQEYCPGINPDVPHREFVAQGLIYLQENDLVHPPEADSPAALVTGHIFTPHPDLNRS